MPATLAELAARNPTYAFAAALVRGLQAGGVRHACVAPGSRSAPLAICLAAADGLALHVQLDERSTAFFALGLAKASRAPIALVCTSGTAAANFHPAVIEADLSGAGLVVLTADRPPEVRAWGAAQAIDQVHLYGGSVRAFFEPPAPMGGPGEVRLGQALGRRAAQAAGGRTPGPVHVNVPFREPLHPERVDGVRALAPARNAPHLGLAAAAPPEIPAPAAAASRAQVEALVDALADTRRPAIVVGPWDPTAEAAGAVERLARRIGAPILAEAASGLRVGPNSEATFAGFDAALGVPGFAERHAPDVVLRLGGLPTSPSVAGWLAEHPAARVVAIDERAAFVDPTWRVDLWLQADPQALLTAAQHGLAQNRVEPAWLAAFQTARKVVADASETMRDGATSRAMLRAVWDAMPPAATLFLANSRTIRDADAVLPADPRPVRILASRGANGIDGQVSTVLGVAAAGSEPCVGILGDLAFLHDVGGLFAAARARAPVTLVVLNDGGGGIFDQLPVAAHADELDFESLFRVPHAVGLAEIAAAYGCRHVAASDASELAAVFRAACGRPGVDIVEARLDPKANLASQRSHEDAVAHGLAAAGLA